MFAPCRDDDDDDDEEEPPQLRWLETVSLLKDLARSAEQLNTTEQTLPINSVTIFGTRLTRHYLLVQTKLCF